MTQPIPTLSQNLSHPITSVCFEQTSGLMSAAVMYISAVYINKHNTAVRSYYQTPANSHTDIISQRQYSYPMSPVCNNIMKTDSKNDLSNVDTLSDISVEWTYMQNIGYSVSHSSQCGPHTVNDGNSQKRNNGCQPYLYICKFLGATLILALHIIWVTD